MWLQNTIPTVRWLRGPLGRAEASGAGKKAAYTQAALAIADAYAGVLGLKQPANTTVRSTEAAVAAAENIGYPLVTILNTHSSPAIKRVQIQRFLVAVVADDKVTRQTDAHHRQV